MKLYVITIDEVFDDEQLPSSSEVRKTMEEAIKFLKGKKEEIIPHYKRVCGDEYYEEETENSFECYHDGEYSRYHFRISIEEVEVK